MTKCELLDKIKKIPYMILETFQPQIKFLKVPVVNEGFFKILEKNNKKYFSGACGRFKTKFYLHPKSYFINKGIYYIFLELSVRFKGIQDYYFIAENIVLKYTKKEFVERFQNNENIG